ncbi:dihydropteroate synthase [Thermodesulfovibrionales bacterium]|nr:dihydropteroate synthase [Thermodesulfovibrionales bacterium]MCL0046990.1 dihydropteroate synthase [Thermodesulfovibrionales bacterium]MCL0051626.1 dihydropteroate synthase [Thermodesulfovibrionales bacterium]MCL0068514.1 dihydropteroate synthase [Thermodesulfovibrionales bacterium]MCL0072287.1 dihydropteroate synthase [Thermodesulfovibrionales bacterium]
MLKIEWADFCLDFRKKSYIMGVINVTPDSFSDGGLYVEREKAIEHAYRLVEEGADIIDIGGESTRPGSESVEVKEEIRRTIPLIEGISKKINIPISIDTYKAEVARCALDAGASIVNDISGLRFDSRMPEVIASYGVPVIIMHIKGRPKEMQHNPVYDALLPEIMDYIRVGIRLAAKSGISGDKIIIDPGIGFGKTFEHNLEIIKNLREFTLIGKPVAIGVSRKAFIGKILDGAPPTERQDGTAAAVAISIFNGANILRVHDVAEMSRVAKVVDAIKLGSTFSEQ